MGDIMNPYTSFQQTPHGSWPQVKQKIFSAGLRKKRAGTPFQRRHAGAGAENGDFHVFK
jgi:hypothetical protein